MGRIVLLVGAGMFLVSAVVRAADCANEAPGSSCEVETKHPTQRWDAKAYLRDAAGKEAGVVKLLQTPNGVLIKAKLKGLSPGAHAMHIHETGACEPPFKSAGGHFNPTGKSHGFNSPKGWHAGDLPNIYADEQGNARVEVFAPHVSLQEGDNPLLDQDGSAFIIHAHADDQHTDPAGDAGDRVACGVIEIQDSSRGTAPAQKGSNLPTRDGARVVSR